jgi:hypothetical protein
MVKPVYYMPQSTSSPGCFRYENIQILQETGLKPPLADRLFLCALANILNSMDCLYFTI